MSSIILSRQAKKDLDIIYESPLHARRQIDRMLQRIRQISSSPLTAGRIVPELKQESILEIFEGRYRIVYRHIATDDRLEIITIMAALRPPKA